MAKIFLRHFLFQTLFLKDININKFLPFVRFKLTKDDYYFASISPDFDVLPLISKHFKNRYADQKWIIYDIKRKYGLKYYLKTLDVISFNFSEDFDFTKTSTNFFLKKTKKNFKNFGKTALIAQTSNQEKIFSFM